MRKVVLICIFLLLSACTNLNEVEQKQLKEKLVALTEISEFKEPQLFDIDNAVKEAEFRDLDGEERDWFVRTYLLYVSGGKELDLNAIQEDSQLMMKYEQAWRELANERYEIELDESRLDEIIEMTLIPLKEDQADKKELQFLLYLSKALGYSLEEFYYTFDRHHYEKFTIGESLFPLLEKDYGINDNQEISRKYRMEVIDKIVENQ